MLISKNNQAMQCGQSIEYSIRNIFLEHFSSTKYGGEASPRNFYKKSKLSISLGQQSEMVYLIMKMLFFIVCPS